jgi:hypothetical protein
MKKLIIACSFLFTLTGAFANTCTDDPEETISRKISEQVSDQAELKTYPSARGTYAYINDNQDSIKNISLARGRNWKSNVSIKVKFNDGSDARINFNLHELGSRTMQNVYYAINVFTKSKAVNMKLNLEQLNKIMGSKTVKPLTAKVDYQDADTEIGSKENFEHCSLELEVRAQGAKVDQFTGGLF